MPELTPLLGPDDAVWRFKQRHHDATHPIWVNETKRGRIPKSIMQACPSGAVKMIDGFCKNCQGRGSRE